MEDEKQLVPQNNKEIVAAQSNDLADKIVAEDDVDKLKQLTAMFNLIQQKKNVLRILKYNGLLDSLADQMDIRINKKADEFSNEDLLKYMQTIQSALEKSNTQLKLVDDTPAINFNQQNNVNINVSSQELNREERERVAEVIKAIMQGANKTPPPEDIIVEDDGSVVEENSTENISDEDDSKE